MSQLREAAQKALEALEVLDRVVLGTRRAQEAITALKAALAEPDRKPLTDAQIADLWHQTAGFHHHFARAVEAAHGVSGNA